MKTPKDVLVRKLPGFLYGTWSAEGLADALLEGLAAAGYVVVEAAEIERLKAERDDYRKAYEDQVQLAQNGNDLYLEAEAQLAEMREVGERLMLRARISPTMQGPRFMGFSTGKIDGRSLNDDYRAYCNALASDAGKAAADVLAAVEAVRNLPFQHTGAIGALFDAYDAYRKEGLELVKTPDGPAYLRPGGEASEGRGDG